MSGGNSQKTPAEALRSQLQELGGLRNASARDATFKTWRQNTLTLIQRVWADDDTRAERFRRIPFSTSSGKSSAAQTRQNFERGCSEAIWLLREWIEAAHKSGLTFAEPGGRSDPSLPGSQEDDFPVLNLPADGSTAGQVTNQAVNTTPIAPDLPTSPMTAPRVRSEAPAPPLVSPFAEPLELPPSPPKVQAPPKPAKPAKPAKSNGHAKPAAAKAPPAPPAPPAPKQPVVAKAPPAPPAPPAPKQPVTAKAPPAPPAPPAPKQPVVAKAPPAPPAPPAPKQPVVAKAPPAPPPAAAEAPPAAAPGYQADLDAAFDAFLDHKGGEKPPRSAGPKRALKEMLGFTDESGQPLTAEPFEFPHVKPVEASRPAEPVPAPPAASSEPPPAGWPDAADDPGIGIEWKSDEALAFEIVEPPEAPPEPPIAFVRPAAAEPPAPPRVTREPERPAAATKIPASFDEADLPQFEVVSEEDEAAVASAVQPPVASAPPEPPPPAPRDEAAEEAAEMNDFLSRSPVLGASPRPVPPRGALPLRSPTGSTLAAMAAEVGNLGVPEGQRAAVRAMLLDLAREFDDGRASWETMRHAVVFVMEYPSLARRVLPMLIPYLDQAA